MTIIGDIIKALFCLWFVVDVFFLISGSGHSVIEWILDKLGL